MLTLLSPHWLLVLTELVAASSSSAPLPQNTWIGETVLHNKPHQQIQFGDRIGGREVKYDFSGIWPFFVRDEKDGWLRIHDRRHEGWVDKNDFVLLSEAIPYFTGRLERNPRDYFALHMRGAAWTQKKQYDKAIADFDAAIAINPKDAGAYNNRGVAYRESKQYDQAIADFSQAISLFPRHAVYFLNRGAAWRLKGNFDNAIDDYDEAIRLEPRYALAFHNRGIARYFKKDYEGAITDYDASIRLDPKYAPAFRERGAARRMRKQYARALADFDAAIALAPSYAIAYTDRAWILATCPEANLRDGTKALVAAKKACELTKYQTPSHLSVLAAAYAEMGNYQEAVRWQQKALEFPAYAKQYGTLARGRLKLYEANMPYREGAALSPAPPNRERPPR